VGPCNIFKVAGGGHSSFVFLRNVLSGQPKGIGNECQFPSLSETLML